MIKYLMALDPGKATGAVLLDYTDADESTPPTVVKAYEPAQYEVCSWVEHVFSTLAREDDQLEVVMEQFYISTETGKKKDVNYSLEIIGTVRYLAEKYDIPYSFQSPGEAKNFVDNDRIRSVGLWVPGGEGHHKDAMRHAIKYLVFQKGWRPAGLVG